MQAAPMPECMYTRDRRVQRIHMIALSRAGWSGWRLPWEFERRVARTRMGVATTARAPMAAAVAVCAFWVRLVCWFRF